MKRGKVPEYAKHRENAELPGSSVQAVYNAIRLGWIVRDSDKSIDFAAADASWAKRSTPRMRPPLNRGGHEPPPFAPPGAPPFPPPGKAKAETVSGSQDDPRKAGREAARKRGSSVSAAGWEDYDEARTRKIIADANIAELELEQKRGDLVPVDVLERALFDILSVVRNRLENMGAGLSPTLVALTDLHATREAIDNETNTICADVEKRLLSLAEGVIEDGTDERTSDAEGEPAEEAV